MPGGHRGRARALHRWRFTDPRQLDIDHLVPLRHAHDTGAGAWSAARKREYASYLAQPAHLVAVESRANRSKGAKGPADWCPPNQAYWCKYATDWRGIKQQWSLRIDQREAVTLAEMLATCSGLLPWIGRRVTRTVPASFRRAKDHVGRPRTHAVPSATSRRWSQSGRRYRARTVSRTTVPTLGSSRTASPTSSVTNVGHPSQGHLATTPWPRRGQEWPAPREGRGHRLGTSPSTQVLAGMAPRAPSVSPVSLW